MTREYEPDPEVLRDLALRESSERDPSRSRGAGVYDWAPPKIAGLWRCRRPGCNEWIGVTADSLERLADCNRWLAMRGEPPLDHTAPVTAKERTGGPSFCDACRAEFQRGAPDRRRAQVERLAVKIRELKESRDPTRERDVILQLREWGHPDVDGLVQAIVERNASGSGRKPRREL